jgi:peptidoglycan/LPS O-acetylase OafA/YrhL
VNVNPSLRAFAILILIAAVITVFQLGFGLVVIIQFLQVLFLLAIAYVLFVLWRRHREEIAMWSTRSRIVFYGGAALAVAAVGLAFTPWFPKTGLETVVCIAAVAAGVFGMWRVWRDEHTYGY